MLSLITGLAVALWQAGVARQQARIAEEQAHTARATQTFIENIFRANSQNQPDPAAARKTTARELLDVGAAQIDSALNDTPEAKLGMLRTLSDMYDDLGLSDKMMELERKHLDIARKLYGKDDARLALALTMFANVAERIDLHAASEPAYLEAEGILDRIHDDKSFPRAALETNLGFFYYSTDLSKALYHADKGVIAYRLLPPSRQLSNALVGESYIYKALGDYANAKKTAEEALTVANSIGADGNDQLGQIYEGLGFAHSGLEEIQAAEVNFMRSRDIATAGLGDVVFDQLEAAGPLGEFLVATSRVSEGIEVLRQAHDLALTLTGARAASSRPARTLMRYGAALVAVGRLEEGMKSLDLAETLSTRQGQDPLIELVAQVLDVRAMGLLELGDMALAEQLLARADEYHRQSGELKTPNNNRNAAAHVRLLMLSGREAEATKALEEYWVGTTLPAAARPRLEELVMQAELALAQGNLDASSNVSAKALSLIVDSPNRPYLKIWELRASLVQGKSKLLAGESTEAQPPLRVSVDIAEQILDRDRSPILADARIALAESCLDLGQRARANQLLASAQGIQAAHRMLGEQYTKPLRHLKARLDSYQH
jgi:serine/threonine-protein kinase